MTSTTSPLVSVVIEGYNQARDLGAADATIAGLMAQDYPRDRIEIVLVGSPPQIEGWKSRYANGAGFHAMKFVPFDQLAYYEFKNSGADVAAGDIIAMTDSDVLPSPRWVSAIVDNIAGGADASMGITLFGDRRRYDPDSALLRMAAAITWGWVLGPPDPETGRPQSRGFLDHNIAMRAELWRAFRFRTDLGRIIASPLLFRRLVLAGKRVRLHTEQVAAHHFSWRYWLVALEYRYGHEVYRLRRLDSHYPNQWIAKTGPFEPLVTFAWHILLDVPKWFRFNRVLGSGALLTIVLFPPYLVMSGVSHLFEMAGMVATMLAPKRTRHWAEGR